MPQSAICELSQAIDLVDCLKHDLADARSNCEAADRMRSDIWKSVENIIKAHDLAMEVSVRKQRAWDNRRLKDCDNYHTRKTPSFTDKR